MSHLCFVSHKPHSKVEVSEAVTCSDCRRPCCPAASNCFLELSSPEAAAASPPRLEALWGTDCPFCWASSASPPPRPSADVPEMCYTSHSLCNLMEKYSSGRGRSTAPEHVAEPTEQRDLGVRLQKGSRNRQGAARAELLPSHVSQQGNRSSPASQAEPVADGSDTERERRAEGQKQPRWEQRGSQPSSFMLGQAGGQPGGGDQGDIPRQWEAREKSFSPCKGGTNA